MMELSFLKNDLHSQLLTLRALNRIITTAEFELLFCSADEQAKEAVEKILESKSIESLEKWMDIQRGKATHYSQLSMRDLRKFAQGLGVPGYIYLPKSSLLSAIRNRENVTR